MTDTNDYARELIEKARAQARESVTDLTDKISDTALGKKLTKAQAVLAFWDEQWARVNAPKVEPPKPATAGEIADLTIKAALAAPQNAARSDDPGPIPTRST